MTATHKDRQVEQRLDARGIRLHVADCRLLRRAERTLHAWAELECGLDNGYASHAIERDETTGTPYRVIRPHASGGVYRSRTPDREAGALKRIAALCRMSGIYYYHQTDPRGCALYVATEPLTDRNYSSVGAPCCAD